jgi:4-hydroxythreonine-4-phosphate dehydrogenase
MKLPVIGITTGDPNGIGPEVSIKAALDKEILQSCLPVLYGSSEMLKQTADRCSLSVGQLKIHESKGSGSIEYGKVTARAGRAAMTAVEAALQAIQNKAINGMVTAPISKEAVHLAGLKDFSGHTEYIARFAGSPDHCLALYADNKAIAFVSTHVSLRQAIKLIKKDRIRRVTSMLNAFLASLGEKQPRIGISGLNPHAGEGGLFGEEEVKEIIPAVKALQNAGISVFGPVPPDVIFPELFGDRYDGVVSMVHDHGHVAFKTAHFRFSWQGGKTSGVNITLGLPFVRTSADHGTAFGIAGKNQGDCGSMKDAIKLAIRLILR